MPLVFPICVVSCRTSQDHGRTPHDTGIFHNRGLAFAQSYEEKAYISKGINPEHTQQFRLHCCTLEGGEVGVNNVSWKSTQTEQGLNGRARLVKQNLCMCAS